MILWLGDQYVSDLSEMAQQAKRYDFLDQSKDPPYWARLWKRMALALQEHFQSAGLKGLRTTSTMSFLIVTPAESHVNKEMKMLSTSLYLFVKKPPCNNKR